MEGLIPLIFWFQMASACMAIGFWIKLRTALKANEKQRAFGARCFKEQKEMHDGIHQTLRAKISENIAEHQAKVAILTKAVYDRDKLISGLKERRECDINAGVIRASACTRCGFLGHPAAKFCPRCGWALWIPAEAAHVRGNGDLAREELQRIIENHTG